MRLEPPAPAVAESYPTFWDDPPPVPVIPPSAVEDAYAAFVNLTEDDLPADAPADGD